VRPLKTMSGKAHFCEVFFTDARVPVSQVLGEVGGGWGVAMLLLSFERGASALGYYETFRRELDEIIAIARRTPRGSGMAVDDPMIRQKIAAAVVEILEEFELVAHNKVGYLILDNASNNDRAVDALGKKFRWQDPLSRTMET